MITTSLAPFILTILLLSKASGEDHTNLKDTSKRAQITDTGEDHNLEKRHVSSLLGNRQSGQLSYQTVGNVGKRNPASKSSLDELAERLEEAAQEDKRYLGALARTGDLRVVARDRQEKREDLDSLIDELATAEEMRKMQMDALRDDLFEEEPEKRGVVSLARSGYLKPTSHDFMDDDEESVFYPAEPDEDKRGGIASLARNGYYQKRTVDAELEQLMSEVYGIGEKRSVASLARSYNLPNSVKGSYDNDDEKRNIPSLLRDRTSPLGEGKRHIGSFVANHGIPFVNNKDDGKRNLGSIARNRDFPYAVRFGKRDTTEEGDEMSKRYVATLLRQGRLPVGSDASDQGDMVAVKDDHEGDKDDMSQDEASKMTVRKKKSITNTQQVVTGVEGPARTKREAEFGVHDDIAQFVDDAADSPINKRYFGVRGGGKMPGGRLPKVGGRSRSRHENSGRRRH